MSAALFFWILMILWFFLGAAPYFSESGRANWRGGAGSLLLYVIIFLIGWKVFGWPLHE